MINLIFLLLIFFMLTGVIKKKDILDIKRAESIHGVESKVLNDETLLSLDQDGKIFLDNIPTELENLKRSLDFSNSKLVIDVDKRAKILEFNKILDKIKELDKKKFSLRLLNLMMTFNSKVFFSICISILVHIFFVMNFLNDETKDQEIYVLNLSNYQPVQFEEQKSILKEIEKKPDKEKPLQKQKK